jgi:hypothetical protein
MADSYETRLSLFGTGFRMPEKVRTYLAGNSNLLFVKISALFNTLAGIGTGLFLMHSPPVIAQQRIDLYYVRNEFLPTGNKLTYILASEIDSSYPKQIIVQRGGPIAILSLDNSPPPPQADMPTTPVTAYPSNGFMYVYAPYRVSGTRITDRNGGRLIYEQKNINSKILKVNLAELKSGFYTLEIVSVAQDNNKKVAYE